MLDGMTNIKASEVLKEIKYYTEDLPPYSPDEVAEALEMAIQALDAQPCEDCISRSELQKTMDSLPLFRFVNNDHEEADDYYNCESVDMVIRNLPSVTPRINLAETSQDCISREEVQDLISRWLSDYLLDETREALETINYKVGDIPPVTPERPKGKWIFCYGNRGKDNVEKCSCCKSYWKEAVIYRYDTQEYLRLRLKYCPKCGAEMGGADETN